MRERTRVGRRKRETVSDMRPTKREKKKPKIWDFRKRNTASTEVRENEHQCGRRAQGKKEKDFISSTPAPRVIREIPRVQSLMMLHQFAFPYPWRATPSTNLCRFGGINLLDRAKHPSRRRRWCVRLRSGDMGPYQARPVKVLITARFYRYKPRPGLPYITLPGAHDTTYVLLPIALCVVLATTTNSPCLLTTTPAGSSLVQCPANARLFFPMCTGTLSILCLLCRWGVESKFSCFKHTYCTLIHQSIEAGCPGSVDISGTQLRLMVLLHRPTICLKAYLPLHTTLFTRSSLAAPYEHLYRAPSGHSGFHLSGAFINHATLRRVMRQSDLLPARTGVMQGSNHAQRSAWASM